MYNIHTVCVSGHCTWAAPSAWPWPLHLLCLPHEWFRQPGRRPQAYILSHMAAYIPRLLVDNTAIVIKDISLICIKDILLICTYPHIQKYCDQRYLPRGRYYIYIPSGNLTTSAQSAWKSCTCWSDWARRAGESFGNWSITCWWN